MTDAQKLHELTHIPIVQLASYFDVTENTYRTWMKTGKMKQILYDQMQEALHLISKGHVFDYDDFSKEDGITWRRKHIEKKDGSIGRR